MLVAAMRISLVAFLFLMSIYMSHEIVTMPRLGTYSTISRSADVWFLRVTPSLWRAEMIHCSGSSRRTALFHSLGVTLEAPKSGLVALVRAG